MFYKIALTKIRFLFSKHKFNSIQVMKSSFSLIFFMLSIWKKKKSIIVTRLSQDSEKSTRIDIIISRPTPIWNSKESYKTIIRHHNGRTAPNSFLFGSQGFMQNSMIILYFICFYLHNREKDFLFAAHYNNTRIRRKI